MNRLKLLLVAVLVLTSASALFAQNRGKNKPGDQVRVNIPKENLPKPGNKTPSVTQSPALVKKYQGYITPEILASHLYFYASDFFQGRETTAPGQRMAAAWLASQYQRMGIPPKGTSGVTDARDPRAYFQPYKLNEEKLKSFELSGNIGGKDLKAQYSATGPDGNVFLQMGSAVEAEGGVVFAGYGIKEDGKYDDYAALKSANISWAGKWLMIFDKEPMKDGKSLLSADGKTTKWSNQWWSKMTPAFSGGQPLGFLIVSDRAEFGAYVQQQASALGSKVGQLRLPVDGQAGGGGRRIPPFAHISTALANQLLASSGKTAEGLRAEIDGSLKPVVFELTNAKLKGKVENQTRLAETENVVAMIEGTDLKDEYVVVSSHLDHVGWDPTKEGDNIYNGADDDGSGTVTTIAIAEAFARAAADGYRPRRSIIFLNVSGEEKGLFGSEYFADKEPAVPLNKIVTNLNIDMVGRFDPTHPVKDEKNYVYIIGSKLISQELHDLNAQVNKLTGTNLVLSERFNDKNDPNQFYRRSDHWNFGKHNIPFIFFFTGTHEDYHGLEDEAEKIEYKRMADIGRMIFATTWQVANQDARPAVSGTGFN
ncbi:MAG: M28 family peptidase [Rhodothermia bacterium]|nr:M28 family peptidase [Rhodothermia bacterium]